MKTPCLLTRFAVIAIIAGVTTLTRSPAAAVECQHSPYGAPAHFSLGSSLNLTDSPTWFMICREGYQAAFNPAHNVSDWVAMRLRREDLVLNEQEAAVRDDVFRTDQKIPAAHRVVSDDYKYSGYHRGHLAPAASMRRSQVVMDESFFMTNMAPQVGAGFNSGIWKALERRMRWWACERGELHIISGSLYELHPIEKLIFDENEDGEDDNRILVNVPSHFFKIAFDSKNLESIAFILPNKKARTADLDTFIRSIDVIEARASLDLYSQLPSHVESVVEAHVEPKQWPKPTDSDCKKLK